tara:strand:- start:3007 stop:4470 length:1464 start_codon:yes stop_codon:yes gene_type:complete
MKIKSYLKYAVRFLFLQVLLTFTSIFYFENYLISKSECAYCIEKSFRLQVDYYLLDDKSRFLSFVDDRYLTLFSVLALFIFIFLVILYSTKFYTYVNELTFSLDRSYLDEYMSIYLLWTSSLVVFLTLSRISGLVSRAYLILFTFLIPLILLLFRNSEFVSSLLGRSITNENYVVINLEEDSVFRKLRIATFRKKIKDINNIDLNNPDLVISEIDSLNKTENINLIIMNIGDKNTIDKKLEDYLINLNKKVLIISKDEVGFNNYFINRVENISNYYLTYFNNDIQYGSKYILKRGIDILLSIIAFTIFSPIFLLLSLYIFYLDGSPVIIKQNRVGLHGEAFTMYKFRTMKKDAHKMRDELEELNKNDQVIFKIENDPRIISGTQFIRNFSLDEIPQFINVIKGDMSIVGPRPLFDEDTKLFNENYMRRLNVLPGITGLLQINERNTDEFSIWYKYDIEYIENWSLYLDLKIIFLTPFSLFKSKAKGL